MLTVSKVQTKDDRASSGNILGYDLEEIGIILNEQRFRLLRVIGVCVLDSCDGFVASGTIACSVLRVGTDAQNCRCSSTISNILKQLF